jgi:hypothetical protein
MFQANGCCTVVTNQAVTYVWSLQWSFSSVCICRDLSATSPTHLLRRLSEQTFTGVKASELRSGDVLFETHIRMPTLI